MGQIRDSLRFKIYSDLSKSQVFPISYQYDQMWDQIRHPCQLSLLQLHRGYVNFDFATGQTLWQTSGYEPRPFLPLVDFFGNALTSDTTTFKLLWWDGSTQAEVNLTNFRPEFGWVRLGPNSAMLAPNETILVLLEIRFQYIFGRSHTVLKPDFKSYQNWRYSGFIRDQIW